MYSKSSENSKLLVSKLATDLKVYSDNSLDSSEYYGVHKQNRSKLKTILTAISILITEFCERLTHYSLVSNMIPYCTTFLKMGSLTALNTNFIFTGVSYFIPVFAGCIGDAISGRFNAIYGSGLIYLVGSFCIIITAFDFSYYFGDYYDLDTVGRQDVYLIGLAFVAVGTGGIKANVSPFGAQQVEHLGQTVVQSFFNWFYWFVNLGAGLATTVVAYLQQEVSYFYGYLVPFIAIFVAVILFVIPKNHYIHQPVTGSAFTDIFKIIICAFRKRASSLFQFRSFLDYARLSNGGDYTDEQVDNLIKFGRIIPVAASMIIFWYISLQIHSTFVLQGMRMNLNIGSFQVPVISITIFNTIVILVAAPFVDRILFPVIRKIKGSIPSMLQRIGTGFLFAALAVVAAGVVEILRKRDMTENGPFIQDISGVKYNASSISIFWQVPQFVLVGSGEVLSSITSYEFAFAESPAYLRSIAIAVFLIMTGIGSFLGSAMVAIVNSQSGYEWVPDEINNGHLEYYYFLSAGIMVVNFAYFLLISRWYSSKRNKHGFSHGKVKYSNLGHSAMIDSVTLSE